MTLIAIILTHNEAHNIAACMDSLRWADSILVFDSFSTDDTVKIAEEAGAQVIQHAFTNYSVQRDAALNAVTDEWVYFVDADERSSPEQAAEIRRRITDPAFDGYWVPRHNYIFGHLTRYTGWYPDYQLRLLRRAKAQYDLTREVHELVILDGKAGHLDTPLVHYNYHTLAQFIRKQEAYTDLAAREMFRQGIRVRPQNYILQPIRHFVWRFITLQGYRDGLHGLRLSLLMAWYEFQKYVRLRREWNRAG
ncbi:MAG: glycosyltransferase family 2 protein [Anaerolineae bacterium]|nr:glycosyltransferase family 2 protein [Anaerolineae bacterium]